MAGSGGALRRAHARLGRVAGRVSGFARGYWRGLIAGLVALAALALVTVGPTALVVALHNQADDQAQAAAATFRVGDPVQDGPVTFVVHQVRCGPVEEDSIHGRLCEVTVGARNAGTEEVAVPSLAQTLHVAEGARHQPVRPGTGRLGPLAPSEEATAIIRFDLPLAATITHLELRADTYSRGVPVAIETPYPLLSGD